MKSTTHASLELKPNAQIAISLDLQPGDIIISEMPYTNPARSDFIINNKTLQQIKPGHSAIWTGNDFDRPLAHSVREGYRPPGLKVTNIWAGRHVVFRYKTDPQLAAQAAEIIRIWATSEIAYDEKHYTMTYPKKFWVERHDKDLHNFFSKKNKENILYGPATSYGEPRGSTDLTDLMRNKKLSEFGEEAIRRAIKFASLRHTKGTISKKGQRCTAIVLAAYQASFFSDVALSNKTKQPFRQYKGKALREYINKVFIKEWQATPFGKKLETALAKEDYSSLLPPAFSLNQRYATPKTFFDLLIQDKNFQFVGCFSYFNNEIVSIYRDDIESSAIDADMDPEHAASENSFIV